VFKFKFYDKETNTSVIKCFPKTGRTHQIRVHLKAIGHPIVNDKMYGGLFMNSGIKDEFDEKDFENAY
jgi:23S rRNA-/tRNA-specific pseudouridylate synthase